MIQLTSKQISKVIALIHSMCANCDNDGRCLMHPLEECKDGVWRNWKCPQTVSISLLCKYFVKCVLPLDKVLYAEIFKDTSNTKICKKCKKPFVGGSNRSKYCSECTKQIHRDNAKNSARKKAKEKEMTDGSKY